MKCRILILCILSLATSFTASAQRAAVSTDAARWLTASPNITVDVLLNDRFTSSIDFSVNPFNEIYCDLSAKHFAVSPELKYWFKRPMFAHYLGVNALYSMYNVGKADDRSRGDVVALGLTYGYSFYLSERWVLTPAIGGGIGRFNGGDMQNGVYLPTSVRYAPTLTKLSVSISYLID